MARTARLSRDRVLQTAIRLADRDGIESLSMRRLARELEVEAMSLYNHVANKEEILGGIADLVADEIELPADTSDWKAAIRRNAVSAREVLVRHRWAPSLWMSGQGGGTARIRHGNWMLRTLREAGLPSELVYHAFHILEAYVLGFSSQELNFPYKGQELTDLATRFLRQLAADDYPDLVEHVKQHLEPPKGRRSGFELGLDLILEGLERSAEPRPKRRARR
jgi:AcrR family transcriptional regulator